MGTPGRIKVPNKPITLTLTDNPKDWQCLGAMPHTNTYYGCAKDTDPTSAGLPFKSYIKGGEH